MNIDLTKPTEELKLQLAILDGELSSLREEIFVIENILDSIVEELSSRGVY